MNIYTENDLKDIVKSTFGSSVFKTTLPISSVYELSKEDEDCFIKNLNEKFNLNLNCKNLSNMSLNDVLEEMNEAIGVNRKNIREFIIEICSQNPQNDALIFDGVTYTYHDLMSYTNKLSSGLSSIGIRKGSKVALILTNRIEYILLYFALFYLGALPVPINTRWGKQELYNVLDNAEPDCIVTEEKIGSHSYGVYVEEYAQTKYNGSIIYFNENHYPGKSYLYEELANRQEDTFEQEVIEPDDIAIISYTSGTTGMPKGVLLKQNDVVKISSYTTQTWRTMKEEYPYSVAPLYSAQGFLSLFIDFAIGKTFKMTSTFNPNDILKEISKGENTVLHTQPTMWSLLLNCRIINFAKFDSLQKIVVSGSLCSPELAKQIEDRLGCTLLNAYGLIEGTSVVTMTRMEDSYDVRMNTVGRPIPGVSIKIVDENRNEVEHGEIGELAVKGYNMLGYYKNEQKTKEVIDEEGWLYTGDLAKYYDDENISIVGRSKDMIIRGGFNVYPSDIEEYLLQLEGVQNAAVVGKNNDILGEEIVAFILLKVGTVMSKNDVIRQLFNKLANYKMPDKVYFVSEIPTILAGKIDKKELRLWAEKGIPEEKQVLFKN